MSDTALLTDRYELSMLQSFVAEGIEDRRATFEVFTRRLQRGFRYGVFAGLGRLVPLIENFEFSGSVLRHLRENKIVDKPTYDYLSNFRFTGTIHAYREGDLYFPNSPVLTVEATLGEAVLLETLILSVLNHDSAIASKAARMVSVSKGRPIIEMGSRRTQEESAVAAARAAYIAGFASTSNLLAGMRYGVPTSGTAAHAFTLAHGSEQEAFDAQIAAHGPGTTLLVDTYNTEQGIHNAVYAAQKVGAAGPGAIRIDSGDLAGEAEKARALLDELEAENTKIIVTSDLDEYVLKDLRDAPIDGYGVGTQLVSTPPAGFVYKLVAIEEYDLTRDSDGNVIEVVPWMRPVAKKAADKVSKGGRKVAFRKYDRHFKVVGETFKINAPWTEAVQQVTVVDNGKALPLPTLGEVREFHREAFATLPDAEQVVWSGNDFDAFLTAQQVTD